MDLKMGDKVIYKGEVWEVGFVNTNSFRGTLRLQKNGEVGAESINRIYPEEVIAFSQPISNT